MTNIKLIQKRFKALCFLLVITMIFPEKSYAYLDPGTGSMVMQVIVASIAAITCTYKIWYSKIMAFFRRNKDDNSNEN